MILTGNGLLDVDMHLHLAKMRGGEEVQPVRFTAQQLRPALLAEGAITEAEFDAAMKLWDDPSYVDLSYAIVSAWGRRPFPV